MVTKLASVGGAWNSPIAMRNSFREGAGVLKRPVGEDQALGRVVIIQRWKLWGAREQNKAYRPFGVVLPKMKHSRRS